jgi:hypothetical protein
MNAAGSATHERDGRAMVRRAPHAPYAKRWARVLLVALQRAAPAPLRLAAAIAFCSYELSSARKLLP